MPHHEFSAGDRGKEGRGCEGFDNRFNFPLNVRMHQLAFDAPPTIRGNHDDLVLPRTINGIEFTITIHGGLKSEVEREVLQKIDGLQGNIVRGLHHAIEDILAEVAQQTRRRNTDSQNTGNEEDDTSFDVDPPPQPSSQASPPSSSLSTKQLEPWQIDMIDNIR